ncbi:hypothetical protein CEXT_191211 [Caerostris extrusa]|uniref:Uncharacterized protein n=1 Tax=Caerostris extrusa TaxID=172846 RepID=A0AAV4N8A8_CAEEX|nr:hypothetical protein CEXT_191211 [Caerostris extrusa]
MNEHCLQNDIRLTYSIVLPSQPSSLMMLPKDRCSHKKRDKQKKSSFPPHTKQVFFLLRLGESYVVPKNLSGREWDDVGERGLIDALSRAFHSQSSLSG